MLFGEVLAADPLGFHGPADPLDLRRLEVEERAEDAMCLGTRVVDGQRLARETFGDRMAYVPYTIPGFALAKSVAEIYAANPKVKGLVLLRHHVAQMSQQVVLVGDGAAGTHGVLDQHALAQHLARDLWPGDLNWVFGQASLTDRVGVWSLHRNGDPRSGQAEFRLCLRRTLKTAVHETGHMLGIPHCAAWECCMNGSRNREESDRQPLEFCHECQAKIWWTCNADPLQRAQALFDFCQKWGLDKEAEQFRKERDTLRSNKSKLTQ